MTNNDNREDDDKNVAFGHSKYTSGENNVKCH